MLGFHRRTRSLIPVKDLGKYDKAPVVAEEDDVDCEMALEVPRVEQRRLTIIYIVFLAEAIMASSLQPQLKMLIANDDFCGNLSTSYLRSILDCAYAFGGTAGIFWGWLSDRLGRRPVALMGLGGMLSCCLCMGFATDLLSCAVFRFVAGLASSSITVTVLTMIGDLCQNPADRVRYVSRLPLIGICGSIGPLVQGMVSGSVEARGEIWRKYPTLSSQIACGTLITLIAASACAMLRETLPLQQHGAASRAGPDADSDSDSDSEKAAFLGQVLIDDGGDVPSIRIVDCSRPEPIGVGQFLQAPSLLVLLSSFSLLSLHSSTFDVLLPHLGHSTEHGGMGIPCSWLGLIVLAVRAVAGVAVLRAVPAAVEKMGLLRPYRSCSALFPAVYAATPLLACLAAGSMPLTTLISTISILIKHTLAGGASILVALLMLNAAPDAFSTGTIVGLMQVASLFKALAVAVSGASYYLSTDFSVAATNYALWTSLGLFGATGAALAWFVKERPSVERDFPAEVLCWETCFDSESCEELAGYGPCDDEP